MQGILVQLNASAGGLPKTALLLSHISRAGVAGDWQRNRKYHGGPDRAVCLYSEELFAALRADGVDLPNGAVGENFTTRGIDLQALSRGDRLRVGADCVIEITDVRVPCRTLKQWSAELPKLMEGRSGWVAKVVTEGTVKPSDPIVVFERAASTETRLSRGTRQAPAETGAS